MSPAELEGELDAFIEGVEVDGLEAAVVERLRVLGARPEHWRPMRAYMDRMLEGRDTDRPAAKRLRKP